MATYYWVGGNGTWNGASTANWSSSTGGAPGAGPPVAADVVIFDDNSGSGMCTTAAGAVASQTTINSTSLSLSLGANLTSSTFFTLTKGTLSLGSSILTTAVFSSDNANTRSISFGTGRINLTGSATNVWRFNTITNFTCSGSVDVYLTANAVSGARNAYHGLTAGRTETNAVNFYVTAGSDTITIASAKTINLTGFSGAFSNQTRFLYGGFVASATCTLTAGSGLTSFIATSGSYSITSNGKTFDFPISFAGIGGTWVCSDALVVGATRTVTLTAGTVKFASGVTSSAGTFAIAGVPSVVLNASTDDSAATISQTSGTVNATNATIKDITAAGGATWNAFAENNNVNAGNNTGWDFGLGPTYDIEFSPALRSFTERRIF